MCPLNSFKQIAKEGQNQAAAKVFFKKKKPTPLPSINPRNIC